MWFKQLKTIVCKNLFNHISVRKLRWLVRWPLNSLKASFPRSNKVYANDLWRLRWRNTNLRKNRCCGSADLYRRLTLEREWVGKFRKVHFNAYISIWQMVLSRTEGRIKKWTRVVAEGWFGEGKGIRAGNWVSPMEWWLCVRVLLNLETFSPPWGFHALLIQLTLVYFLRF